MYRIATAAQTVCEIGNGCTGTSSLPAYGNPLIGSKSGEYELITSSSFSASSSPSSAASGTVAQTGDCTTTDQVTEASAVSISPVSNRRRQRTRRRDFMP
jgi:hypothetical protein